jgi:hypothetical protein
MFVDDTYIRTKLGSNDDDPILQSVESRSIQAATLRQSYRLIAAPEYSFNMQLS